MSLTTCLQKAGDLLPAQDKAAVLRLSREYRSQGLDATAAGVAAVDEQLAIVTAELDALEAAQPKAAPMQAQVKATATATATATAPEVAQPEPIDKQENNIRQSAPRTPWYSGLQAAIEGVPERLASMAAPQWKLWLDANAAKLGVKKEEIEWSGVKDYLDTRGKDKVSKGEIAGYLAADGVKIEEVTLRAPYPTGELDRMLESWAENNPGTPTADGIERGLPWDEIVKISTRSGDSEVTQMIERNTGPASKYAGYTLPGGSNYRELLLTLPDRGAEQYTRANIEPLPADDPVATQPDLFWYFKVPDDVLQIAKSKFSSQVDARDYIIREKQPAALSEQNYTSSHWDQKNVLAHLRVDDRTDADGNKVLMVQEIQSDWGADGRKKGFKKTLTTAERQRVAELDTITESRDFTPAEQAEYDGLRPGFTLDGVVPGPFVTDTKSYVALALKRAIKLAVDEGYDKVAMVTGEQAADFFDLSKRVDRIAYSQQDGGEYQITARRPGSDQIEVIGQYPASALPGVVGQDAANKITSSKKKIGLLSGLDLKVGGEGMHAFYDSLVPNVLRDVLKKLGGGKMETVSLAAERFSGGISGVDVMQALGIPPAKQNAYWSGLKQSERDDLMEAERVRRSQGLLQPGFTLTPAMKENAAGGMVMFSAKRDPQTETAAFKKWFGDWQDPKAFTSKGKGPVSFAVGKDKQPLILYHATNADISEFEVGRETINSTTFGDDITARHGIFTSPDVQFAEEYLRKGAGQNVMPLYMSIQSPLDMREGLNGEDQTEIIANADGKMTARDFYRMRPTDHWQLFDGDFGANFVAAARKAGFDGAIMTEEAPEAGTNHDVYVAFDAAQLKSAIGNNGDFDSAKKDISQSTGRTATGASWESPIASKFDDLVYKFQDKQIETKRVVEAIQAASGGIADDLNVYLNEELFHGRAAKRTEDFVNLELNPMVEEMARNSLKIADVEEFLHARHAQEANAVIAQRNPNAPGLQDGGSGMTNAEAAGYLASLAPADRAKLQTAADKVDQIIRATRAMYVDYDLESQDTVDGWDGMFQHYIPLQREDKNASPGIGQGFSIKGKETKGRTGSTRKVVDILANVAMQRERAIVRGEKNRVAQSLIGLAENNDNPDFWVVDEVPTERVFNPATGLVEDRADPMYKSRENAVVAKVTDANGQVRERAVVFNEDDPRALRMAVALKNLDATQLEGLLGVSAKITRYFARVNTSLNPIFGIVNLVRDVQGAMLNLTNTPLANDKAKIARYTASALTGIYSDLRAARRGQSQTSAWAALWDEFQEVGGQTGYRDLFATSADRGEAIQKALDPTLWMDSPLGKVFTANGALKVPLAQAQKQAGALFDWLSDYNDAMENGVRLSAYKAGLERGLSKQQAASVAKNLTTNFNRKGQVSQQAGAIWAFFNAAIQGTARIGQTLFDMEPGKPKTMRLSKTGKKIVYGGILLGSVQAMALAAAGFGDEDPPEFTRERSLIIPTGGKTYISIPMPLGMHIIPNIGRVATEFALSGFKDPVKRSIGLVGMFADAFNPIGNAGLSMQTLAPTALDPLVALTENKDWTGRPIAKTSFNKAIPGHTMGRDTSTAIGEFLSESINTLSGGNEYVAGVFSPKPDQVDYLLGQLTGGLGREYSKIEQSLKAGVRGEALPTYKIPLVGRFIGNAEGQASEGSAFYANVDQLNEIETEAKGLKEAGKTKEARALLASKPEAYLITQANYAENQARKLRKEKSELIKAGAPRAQVRAIEEKITGVMARLNRAMEKIEATKD